MGDLNYRIDLDDMKVRELIKTNNINELLQYDQLFINKQSQGIFKEMKEEKITFLPTFKTIIRSNEYSQQRIPSYCDRILYWSKESNIIGDEYCSYPLLTQSDHFPISCQFLIK